MVFKKKKKALFDDGLEGESKVWTIGDLFSLEIMGLIRECNYYEKVAIYGSSNIYDSLQIPEQIRTKLRVESLKRFASCIYTICDLTESSPDGKDKEFMLNIKKRINGFNKCYGKISRWERPKHNQKEIIVINENIFMELLSMIQELRRIQLYCLYKMGFIFKKIQDNKSFEDFRRKFVGGD